MSSMDINVKAQEMYNVSVRGPLFVEGPTMYRPKTAALVRRVSMCGNLLYVLGRAFSLTFDKDGHSIKQH